MRSSPSSSTRGCRRPTTRPSARCATPSSPAASASAPEPTKAAGSTPPASASSPPAANGTSRPGPTPAASSPPPGRTCRCPQSPRKPSPERRFPPAGSGVSTRKNPTNDSLPQTPMRQSSREPDSIGYTALNKGNVNGYSSTIAERNVRQDDVRYDFFDKVHG